LLQGYAKGKNSKYPAIRKVLNPNFSHIHHRILCNTRFSRFVGVKRPILIIPVTSGLCKTEKFKMATIRLIENSIF
jgi:hypothetical protein